MATEKYDVIVIGTGQGGKPAAQAFAQAGRKTAVIEQKYVGGSCINYGCTPTKTMVASARIAHLVQQAADYGVEIPQFSVNLRKIRERKDAVVKSWRDSGRKGLEEADNLELIFGEARFTSAHEIEVSLNSGGTRQLGAETIVINTGAKPVIPEIPGLNDVSYLDSTAIMELEETPSHLMIMGGGYVGLEFGQMFRRFGSKVTIIQRGAQLLPREDDDVGDEMARILREDGIEVLLNSEATKVRKMSQGSIRIIVKTEKGEEEIEGSHLLVAVGRKPNSGKLNLEAAGIKTGERGHIEVNDRLETNIKGLYAIGDVKPGPAFTHISYDDFRVLRTNLLENGNATIRGRMVPYTVYTDPELGRVGLSEQEARKQGKKIRVAKLPMSHVARAIEMDETRGFMKAIVDAENDRILGCAILGINGGEIMAVLQVAMMGGLPYTAIRNGVFAHPTLAESLNNLFMNLE
jgi:dihydrolipoamide dehydrogenase